MTGSGPVSQGKAEEEVKAFSQIRQTLRKALKKGGGRHSPGPKIGEVSKTSGAHSCPQDITGGQPIPPQFSTSVLDPGRHSSMKNLWDPLSVANTRHQSWENRGMVLTSLAPVSVKLVFVDMID